MRKSVHLSVILPDLGVLPADNPGIEEAISDVWFVFCPPRATKFFAHTVTEKDTLGVVNVAGKDDLNRMEIESGIRARARAPEAGHGG